jgi:plasmid replication initiation protein
MNLHEIKSIEARKIYDSAKGDFEKIEKCYKYCCEKKVNSITAYMIKLVKEFVEPKGNIPKSNFNSYEQRTYDFDDLEKKLLGWDNNDEENLETKIEID